MAGESEGIVTYYWHLHHEELMEELTEPVENRIAYITANKPTSEIATRLRLLRPVRDQERADIDKAIASARAAYYKAIAPVQAADRKSVV